MGSVNGGVLAGIIVAAVVAALLVVVIVVPCARRRSGNGTGLVNPRDIEQGLVGGSHLRTKSGLDAELPLLHPVSPILGESALLSPTAQLEGIRADASNHRAEKLPRSDSSHHGAPESKGIAAAGHRPSSERTRSASRSSTNAPGQNVAPPQASLTAEQPSRSKSRVRLALPHSPMSTLIEQSDGPSSGDENARPLSTPSVDGAGRGLWSRSTALARLASQPLTNAFRSSLRSVSTQSLASSPSTAALHHYPSITASTATYATARDEMSPTNSRTDVSLKSLSSHAKLPRSTRPDRVASPPSPGTHTVRRAHLRPPEVVQTPVQHEQLPPMSMPRQASINFVESVVQKPGRSHR